jgi:hypothetical protein
MLFAGVSGHRMSDLNTPVINSKHSRLYGVLSSSCTESQEFSWIVLENQIFVEIHPPAEGCDESRKNGG